MDENHNILGQRIRNLREDNDLTQRDLSQLIGLTPKMISFYENNQRTPPVDILLKLAKIFHVTTDYLLGNETVSSNKKVPSLNWEKILATYPNAIRIINEQRDILTYYDQLSLTDKRWIMGQMIDLIKKAEESTSIRKSGGER